MADLLQRLSLALLLAVAASAADFSHKLHLKLKLACVNCHVSAASSRRVEDNNLPARSACAGCHKDVRIKAPRVTLVSKFSHQQHVKLGMTCVACHRGLENSDAVTPAAFPPMADCIVCHNKIEPPFSCVTCHAPDAKLKPATHTADYMDTHSRASVDKSSCAVCHGRQFTCLGCH